MINFLFILTFSNFNIPKLFEPFTGIFIKIIYTYFAEYQNTFNTAGSIPQRYRTRKD